MSRVYVSYFHWSNVLSLFIIRSDSRPGAKNRRRHQHRCPGVFPLANGEPAAAPPSSEADFGRSPFPSNRRFLVLVERPNAPDLRPVSPDLRLIRLPHLNRPLLLTASPRACVPRAPLLAAPPLPNTPDLRSVSPDLRLISLLHLSPPLLLTSPPRVLLLAAPPLPPPQASPLRPHGTRLRPKRPHGTRLCCLCPRRPQTSTRLHSCP